MYDNPRSLDQKLEQAKLRLTELKRAKDDMFFSDNQNPFMSRWPLWNWSDTDEAIYEAQSPRGLKKTQPRTERTQTVVKNTDAGSTISILLPGLDQADVDVSLSDNKLVISTSKPAFGSHQPTIFHFELAHKHVDCENITATLLNGVLTVNIPRVIPDRTKGDRRITVK